ncbi:MAG: hypothetical protein QOF41_464 [Methylobacteriaceae bacterium]|jgi:hypothetical protein|nr:hypothetical protein [Methylobacteriaceae bacterium]
MHPYKSLPERQFWSKAVSTNFDPADVGTFRRPLIRPGEKVMSAGSCFASRLVPYLEKSGFEYVKTSSRHPHFLNIGAENLGYETFSAPYGNIYTARHLLQLAQRCVGKFSPQEDRWHCDGAVIDPFRPGLRFFARSDREFDLLTKSYLGAVLAALQACDVFIFTLGLTEAWRSKLDGAVYPACPGTVAGTFDAARHELVNLSAADVANDLNSFVDELREVNPKARVILTVSPVPMIATATHNHVLAATSYTKSVLRVAAEQAACQNEEVFYFPFYEIVTGPQAPKNLFEQDFRSISPEALEMVMSIFFASCEVGEPVRVEASPVSEGLSTSGLVDLSSRLSALECEEAAQDQ